MAAAGRAARAGVKILVFEAQKDILARVRVRGWELNTDD